VYISAGNRERLWLRLLPARDLNSTVRASSSTAALKTLWRAPPRRRTAPSAAAISDRFYSIPPILKAKTDGGKGA
jgi:hypothetical protein